MAIGTTTIIAIVLLTNLNREALPRQDMLLTFNF